MTDGPARSTLCLIVPGWTRHKSRAVLGLLPRPALPVRPGTIIYFYFIKHSIYIYILYLLFTINTLEFYWLVSFHLVFSTLYRVRSWVHNLTKHNFFAIFHDLMGERGQVNGPAQHDYHQAGVQCLGRGCGTRAGRARPDYPSGLTGPCRAGPGRPFGHLYPGLTVFYYFF
jgi:hypothetical protein